MPTISGKKIQLTDWKPAFGPTLFGWYYQVDYKNFFREFEGTLSKEDCANFDQLCKVGGISVLAILETQTQNFIGLVTYNCIKRKSGVARMGILLDAKYQHHTHCIDTLITLMDYLFSKQNYSKVIVEFLSEDEHIERITKKGGFVFEGILKNEALMEDGFHDETRYAMHKDEFYKRYSKNLEL